MNRKLRLEHLPAPMLKFPKITQGAFQPHTDYSLFLNGAVLMFRMCSVEWQVSFPVSNLASSTQLLLCFPASLRLALGSLPSLSFKSLPKQTEPSGENRFSQAINSVITSVNLKPKKKENVLLSFYNNSTVSLLPSSDLY